MTQALQVNAQLAFWSDLSLFLFSSFSRLKLPKCIFDVVRDIYAKLTKQFDLGPNAILKLMKPLYGLFDSNNYQGRTTNYCFRSCLVIESTTNDGSFFFKMLGKKLSVLFVSYVDEFPQAFIQSFQNHSRKTEKCFSCKCTEYENIQFSGAQTEKLLDLKCPHPATLEDSSYSFLMHF